MDNFAKRIEPEIPIFYEHYEKSIDALSNFINISRDDPFFNWNENEEITESLFSLIRGVSGAIEGMESFLQSVKTLPKMSKELNRVKANVSNKLEELLENLRISKSIAIELEKSITN